MKPFLGIDLTTNSKNEQTIGNEFLIKKTPAELTLKIQMQANKMDTTMHKSLYFFCAFSSFNTALSPSSL